jgi:hypothetical protein
MFEVPRGAEAEEKKLGLPPKVAVARHTEIGHLAHGFWTDEGRLLDAGGVTNFGFWMAGGYWMALLRGRGGFGFGGRLLHSACPLDTSANMAACRRDKPI